MMTTEVLKGCTGKDLLMNDRISDFPDDILLRIISSLTLKEAGSTSVLSKRWKHVWAYVPNLNFDSSKILPDLFSGSTIGPVGQNEAKYFRWVDQVVKSHKALAIDEFRVRFNFTKASFEDFDNWIRFAIEKKVKRLDVNLELSNRSFHWIPYNFPSLPPWEPLTSLELGHVSVTGEVLHKFLSDCPNLEVLAVEFSNSLVDLKVDGPLKLKYLKVARCYHMESLEISAPNLKYLHYDGPGISASLKNSPNLAEVYIHSYRDKNLFNDFLGFTSCISRLEVLTLDYIQYFEECTKVFPVAPRLKMLHISSNAFTTEELFSITNVIKSCPFLHKFVLELDLMYDMVMTEATRIAQVFPHDKLKILEITGFCGCEASLGIAMHLIKTFVSVEKIIINANQGTPPLRERRLRAKEEAARLFALVKAGTDFQILCPERPSNCTY